MDLRSEVFSYTLNTCPVLVLKLLSPDNPELSHVKASCTEI